MKNIDDIKRKILEEMEKSRKLKELEKETSKKKKSNTNQTRDSEYTTNWQKRYIQTKQKEGKTQVSIFLDKDNLQKIDSEIVEEAKQNKLRLNRSDIINKAVEFYFENNNKENIND